MDKKYLNIVKHYESCLEKYGDTHKGVDWPNKEDAVTRYQIMLEVIREQSNVSLLDFGCGTGHLLEYILNQYDNFENIGYQGLDISEQYIEIARKKFPEYKFYQLDIFDKGPQNLGHIDYTIMNGVFTEKRELSFDEMWDYFQELVSLVFDYSKKGIAFNVMSKAVDWEREDLFHLPTDLLIDFLTKKLSRNFIIRNDYGLYEYTVYLYK
tara:strand:+ start:332 stop:961 length:630 start_codon:yes stop_codon:yes gene_type:complete